MKLSVKALAITSGLIWAGALLFVGIGNLIAPEYGTAFLDVMDSIYPGYHLGSGFVSIIVCTLYGLVDGAVGGAIFAWVYNCFAGSASPEAKAEGS